MSCLAPGEHYGACISITEMNWKERGEYRPRYALTSLFFVFFSALKPQSRVPSSKHELCINVGRRAGENDGVRTFVIRHVAAAAVDQFFFSSCVTIDIKKEQNTSF